jgi:iron(III) transport system substrate-binding protein
VRLKNLASALVAALVGTAAMLPVVALAQGEVNVYSSRHYDADKQLFAGFTKATGIKVNVIEAETGPLLQRLKSEDRNSPADVLITVDMGNIWRAEEAGVLQVTKSSILDETIPANLRDPNGMWYGISVRARVLTYAKDRVKPSDLSTYEDLADPKWKGKILVRTSTHVYNQSLTASMIAAHGVAKTEAWAKGIAANLARDPKGGDTDQIKAVAAGEGDIAIVNSYYYARLLASTKAEDKAIIDKVGIFFPNQGDRGTHINITGIGVAKYAPNKANAVKLLEYMVGKEAQAIFAEGNNEFPIRNDVARTSAVMSFGKFKTDALNLAELGKNNAEAVKLTDRAGWK